MTKTTNYNLNQWEAEDVVRREDFNADNAAIDAALKTVADAAAGGGNCQIYYMSRLGTGSTGAITINVPVGKPIVLFVTHWNNSYSMLAWRGVSSARYYTTPSAPTVTWGETYVRWNLSTNSTVNLDDGNSRYHIIVLSELTE